MMTAITRFLVKEVPSVAVGKCSHSLSLSLSLVVLTLIVYSLRSIYPYTNVFRSLRSATLRFHEPQGCA